MKKVTGRKSPMYQDCTGEISQSIHCTPPNSIAVLTVVVTNKMC